MTNHIIIMILYQTEVTVYMAYFTQEEWPNRYETKERLQYHRYLNVLKDRVILKCILYMKFDAYLMLINLIGNMIMTKCVCQSTFDRTYA